MALAVQQSFEELGTPLHRVTFVVLDVETTGGSPASASLTEVAGARYRGGELLATYQTFVRPDDRIPPYITALTSISDAMVADAPRIGEMLPSFLEFVGAGVVVGHNVRFDLSFLNHALKSTGRDHLTNATVDTLALARRLVRDMVPDCKLGTLASFLRLTHQPSHRALTDVLATGDLLHLLLERAGTYGITGLEELLDLPRMVGHPQSAKLKLTNRLPHRPGVYWFTDASGDVLYVGKATDLHTRVRSYFSGDTRNKVGRLLRQMHRVHHRVCPGPFTAEVLEGRLIRAWSPPFNRHGKTKRRPPATVTHDALPPPDLPAAQTLPAEASSPPAGSARRHKGRRRRTWTTEDLERDPIELLAPYAERVTALSALQRYEDAAAIRDSADRVRHLLVRHRTTESIRLAGRVVLHIEGEGTVELDGGILQQASTLLDKGHGSGVGSGLEPAFTVAADGHDNERNIVARWLRAHADRVRVLEVGGEAGLSLPADRIPTLPELCTAITSSRSAD